MSQNLRSEPNAIPIISTFSGGGFLDMGFINMGFQIEQAFEIKEGFIDAYNHGIKSYLSHTTKANIIKAGIKLNAIERAVDISNISEQKIIAKRHAGSIEGLIGGPPCQDYSIGGSNKGSEGDRGKLIYSYLELVNRTRPNFIFFENVEGLFRTKNHHLAFLDLVEKLEVKYKLWYEVINSLNHGVPQDRPRLVLVGFKKAVVRKLVKNGYKLIDENKQSDDLVFRWPDKQFSNPKKGIDWPDVWEFGSGIVQKDIASMPQSYQRLTVGEAFYGLDDNSPNQLECFEPYSKKFQTINEGDTYRKSFKRLHRYRYSPTVAYGNNEVHLHPTLPRRLTVREALRLQTVPDTYILPSEMTLTDKFKLISNGVPTRKATLIAREIKRTLTNYYNLK